VEFGDVSTRRMLIQSDDVGSKLGELPDDVGPDPRRTPSYDGTATVVTPQLVDLSQVSDNFWFHDC
jgi:hypothetical protein